MTDFFQQFLLLALPELARAFLDSLYIGTAVVSVFMLVFLLSGRQAKIRNTDKKAWVKLKADHYQRFHHTANEFDKVVSDFEYLTLKLSKNKSQSLESVMLQQLKDKKEEIQLIVDNLKHAKYDSNKDLFSQGYFSANRYISHVETVIKSTREYLDQHYNLEDTIDR